ncbi:DNA ligase [Pseudomonas phage phiPto-bp6g]|nr:DNA ligase [Pseudomonas phage phiPto-bp6g]
MFEKSMFGLNKNGTYKVWTIKVKTKSPDDSISVIEIEHGSEGGKQTCKIEYVEVGKQGRTAYEQAVLQAEARFKKQYDKGYRESKEDLGSVPLLAMLASDYNKVGHRIEFPCYTSVKYDGCRALAIKHAGAVRLESRTGQLFSVPVVENALNKIMRDGDVLDGEIYKHNYELQDILSAVKRTNPQKEIDKAKRAYAKNDSEENEAAVIEAILVSNLRDKLEFHIFDIPMDGDFGLRLLAMDELFRNESRNFEETIHMTHYSECHSDEQLKGVLHPEAVKEGFEGVMLRNIKGVYESGKRSGDLQKMKTFLDEEFLILDVIEDKQGYGVFVLKNNVNDLQFQCVMGDMGQRKSDLFNKENLKGKWLNVKFQTRYKTTLLPQFGVGQYIRDGYAVNGEFVPYD